MSSISDTNGARRWTSHPPVMAGRAIATAIARVVPAIRSCVRHRLRKKDVDARHEAGHDECEYPALVWSRLDSGDASRRTPPGRRLSRAASRPPVTAGMTIGLAPPIGFAKCGFWVAGGCGSRSPRVPPTDRRGLAAMTEIENTNSKQIRPGIRTWQPALPATRFVSRNGARAPHVSGGGGKFVLPNGAPAPHSSAMAQPQDATAQQETKRPPLLRIGRISRRSPNAFPRTQRARRSGFVHLRFEYVSQSVPTSQDCIGIARAASGVSLLVIELRCARTTHKPREIVGCPPLGRSATGRTTIRSTPAGSGSASHPRHGHAVSIPPEHHRSEPAG